MSEDGLDKSRGQTNSKQPVKDPERGPTWHVCGKAEREMWSENSEAQGGSLAHVCRNCSYSLITCVIFLHRTYVTLDFITDLSFYLFNISFSLTRK